MQFWAKAQLKRGAFWDGMNRNGLKPHSDSWLTGQINSLQLQLEDFHFQEMDFSLSQTKLPSSSRSYFVAYRSWINENPKP